MDDLLVYRAKCCNPIRGEAIVGYVTRGKGVAVHSRMCPNVQNLMYDVERKIEVEWARAADDAFPVRIVVHTDDRPGMLNQLTSVLSDENTNIRSLEAKAEIDQDGGVVEMTVDVRDKKQLEKAGGRHAPHFRRARRGAPASIESCLSPTPNTSPSPNRRGSRSIGKTAIAASTASGTCATSAPAPSAPARTERRPGRKPPTVRSPCSSRL